MDTKQIMSEVATTLKKVNVWKAAHNGYPILPDALYSELVIAQMKTKQVEDYERSR